MLAVPRGTQRANARFAVRLITLDGMYYLATESADEQVRDQRAAAGCAAEPGGVLTRHGALARDHRPSQHGWLEAISGVIHGLTARPTATVRTPAVPTAAVSTSAPAPRRAAPPASPAPSRPSPAPSTPEPPRDTTSQPFAFQATRPPPALPTDASAPKDLLSGPALKQGYLARQEPASKVQSRGCGETAPMPGPQADGIVRLTHGCGTVLAGLGDCVLRGRPHGRRALRRRRGTVAGRAAALRKARRSLMRAALKVGSLR